MSISAAEQKVIDLLCELKEVKSQDVLYALGSYEAAKLAEQPVELGKNDYDIMFQLLEPYLDKLIYADTRANGEAFWHCSRYEVLAACKDICEQIAATHPEREATQTCIESIIRRQATGWVMDNEQPIADYLFAKAEEMASAILAVYPVSATKRESGIELHEIAELESRLYHAEQKTQWQPIDTAPKDGTELLLHDRDGYAIGSWSNNYGQWCQADKSRMAVAATHWMPLPPNPTDVEGDSTKEDL